MKSTKEKKINPLIFKSSVFLFIISIICCCTKSLEQKLIGNWESNAINFEGSYKIKPVPSENQYSLKLKNSDGKLIFSDDEQKGTWFIEDSILSLESFPVCTTYIDSLFLVNDAFGNSNVLLKNGEKMIGKITFNGVEPEKVIFSLKLINVSETELELHHNGNSYFYKKIR